MAPPSIQQGTTQPLKWMRCGSVETDLQRFSDEKQINVNNMIPCRLWYDFLLALQNCIEKSIFNGVQSLIDMPTHNEPMLSFLGILIKISYGLNQCGYLQPSCVCTCPVEIHFSPQASVQRARLMLCPRCVVALARWGFPRDSYSVKVEYVTLVAS